MSVLFIAGLVFIAVGCGFLQGYKAGDRAGWNVGWAEGREFYSRVASKSSCERSLGAGAALATKKRAR